MLEKEEKNGEKRNNVSLLENIILRLWHKFNKNFEELANIWINLSAAWPKV